MTGSQSLQSGLSVYNPHMHPQFTEDGKLLISYNSNLPFGAKPGDSIYADFYKPRFVWVPIEGLEIIFMKIVTFKEKNDREKLSHRRD